MVQQIKAVLSELMDRCVGRSQTSQFGRMAKQNRRGVWTVDVLRSMRGRMERVGRWK